MMNLETVNYSGSRLDASLQLGQRIADQWGTHALMIQMSRDIAAEQRTRSRLDESRAAHTWIRRRVKYVPDPINAEMIGDPLTTLQRGGDCDDQAVLAAALLQSIGHDARIGAVTWEGKNYPSHAVTVDLTAGCIVDPVGPPPEAWPPAGYRVASIRYLDKSGNMQAMNGWFSKAWKKIAKPIQKIFPAKTLLGKIVDPLGLTNPKRNLNLMGRAMDVVGTAAVLVAGGWAVGAASGTTAGAGFWATAGTGAKIAGAAALKAGSTAAGWAGSAAKVLGPAMLAMAKGGAAQPAGLSPEQAAAWEQYGPGAGNQGPQPEYSTGSAGGYGGGGGGGSMTLPDGSQAPAPQETSYLLPLAAAAALGLFLITRKK